MVLSAVDIVFFFDSLKAVVAFGTRVFNTLLRAVWD
jgi:hypothetical protein